MSFLRYASGQTGRRTDRQAHIHTDTPIAVLRTPSGSEENIYQNTLAGVVAVSVDDKDVNISDDVGDSVRVVVAVVGVDVSTNVESTAV